METKLGRPGIYEEPMKKVSHTLPDEIIEAIDGYSDRYRLHSRSEVIRRFCQFLIDNPSFAETAIHYER